MQPHDRGTVHFERELGEGAREVRPAEVRPVRREPQDAISVGQGDYVLTFWERFDFPEYYVLSEVLISNGSADPAFGDFVSVYSTADTSLNWFQPTIDLSAYDGQQIHVAFRWVGTFHVWFVDDVVIGPAGFADVQGVGFDSPASPLDTPGPQDVSVRIRNNGMQVIEDVGVSWTVDGMPQSPVNATGLGLAAGAETTIALGQYDFAAFGVYALEATLSLTGDLDPSNNVAAKQVEVSPYRDGELRRILPEGFVPEPGVIDLELEWSNPGAVQIDDLAVNWSVDGVPQTPYQLTGAGVMPGGSLRINFGQYTFPTTGVYQVAAELLVVGDTNLTNNTLTAYLAVDTLWESFEGYVFPPEGWSSVFAIRDQGFQVAPQGTNYYVGSSDNNFFGVITDTLYTPLLDISPGDVFSLNLRTSTFFPATCELIWKNGSTGLVSVLQTLVPDPNTWTQLTANIGAAAGTNRIGIVTTSGGYADAFMDLITCSARPHVFANDLALVEFEQFPVAYAGTTTTVPFMVKNQGQNAVLSSDYEIRLISDQGAVVASSAGVDLAPGEERVIDLDHVFLIQELLSVHAEVLFLADEDQADNTSDAWPFHVVPGTAGPHETGTADYSDANFPFDASGDTWTFSTDDLCQTVYGPSELSGAGACYGFYYQYTNIITSECLVPLRVWALQTAEADLDAGWVDMTGSTLVFDDTVLVRSGTDQLLYIPFNAPMLLTGSADLVIQVNEHDTQWPPALPSFKATQFQSGPLRTRAIRNYLGLDPMDPPAIGFFSQNLPYTTLIVDPITEFGSLVGVVRDLNEAPLAGALVKVSGTPLQAISDASGNYLIENVPYAEVVLEASLLGYNDTTATVTIASASVTQDIHLSARPPLLVTAVVTGSNAPSTPLEFVNASLSGYITDAAQTGGDGRFSFPEVPGQADYQLRLSMRGYQDSLVTFSLGTEALDLGTIVLTQALIAPFDVTAENLGSSAQVSWADPLDGKKEIIANDQNECSFSYTNEVMEDVYLGNRFAISSPVTLTHVDVRFDVFPNAFDFVTVVILDAAENVLVTSEPFITPLDSVITVDIPNIVVDEDVFAMVHWMNNAASTNALCLDHTPGIENTAYIKYPGQAAILLTDFLGVEDGSFIVRLGTLVPETEPTSAPMPVYNVFRGVANTTNSAGSWPQVNGAEVDAFDYNDPSWSVLAPGLYRYSVEAVHATGVSERTISLPIERSTVGIEEDGIIEQVLLMPNPATDQFTLVMDLRRSALVRAELLDALGRKVGDAQQLAGAHVRLSFPVNDLASGMYTLRVMVDGQQFQRKVTVSR